MFPKARIPYGTWGSSYFPAWQMSALAEVNIGQFAGESIPFVLIGNKADLVEDVGVVIDRDEARAFAENEGSIYIETSAKTGINVDESFTELTRRIIDSRT